MEKNVSFAICDFANMSHRTTTAEPAEPIPREQIIAVKMVGNIVRKSTLKTELKERVITAHSTNT